MVNVVGEIQIQFFIGDDSYEEVSAYDDAGSFGS
jgi:hypothetical protein